MGLQITDLGNSLTQLGRTAASSTAKPQVLVGRLIASCACANRYGISHDWSPQGARQAQTAASRQAFARFAR